MKKSEYNIAKHVEVYRKTWSMPENPFHKENLLFIVDVIDVLFVMSHFILIPHTTFTSHLSLLGLPLLYN